jgi:hypothetical protein
LVQRLKLDTLQIVTLNVLQIQHGYLIPETFMRWTNVDGKSIAKNLNWATHNIQSGEQKYWEWLLCAGARYMLIVPVYIYYIMFDLKSIFVYLYTIKQ